MDWDCLTLPSYQYQRLENAKREIRIIYLQPLEQQNTNENTSHDKSKYHASKGTIIRCTLDHVSLDEDPRYEALSYAWGNPKEVCPIEVDGQRAFTTANLASALSELGRRICSPRALWIDALCINQKDNEEKSHQVQMMGEIFRQADGVVVWLGQEDGTSASALSVIRQITLPDLWGRYRAYLRRKKTKVDQTRTMKEEANLLDEETEILAELDSRLDHNGQVAGLDAFRLLVDRPWFERVWVLQEVAMSKDALVMCGPETIPWIRLDRAHRLISFLRRRKLDHKMGYALKEVENRLWLICNVWFDLHHFQKKRSLWYLVGNLSRLKASNPRDLVYALLGLAADAEQLQITIDYSKTVNDVFIEVATLLLRSHGLKLLSHCLLTLEERHRPSRPSWIPDWSSSEEVGLTLRVLQNVVQKGQKESELTESENTVATCWSLSKDVLILTGHVYDSIQCAGEPLPKNLDKLKDINEKAEIVSNWLKDFRALYNQKVAPKTPYLNPRHLTAAFWCTPIADCIFGTDWKLRPADSSDEDIYRMLTDHFESSLDSKSEPRSTRYIHSIIYIAHGRRMFITSKGYIGLGSFCIVPGDFVCVFKGADVPFVLGNRESTSFELVGEAYVHGIREEDCWFKEGVTPNGLPYFKSTAPRWSSRRKGECPDP
ncbi:HET-domain-containing protein [Lepidopterella palustris CBS 459.81]|uniref:HET-domain-containing protein n=1 Tax=Lepidopterella palustris CBS 459.81 TaxID=1314670 RepID=A0A8E2E837_9PEZI|nr:HET-domain-containing protein [Lepidopterella palustris CBS 459.81]